MLNVMMLNVDILRGKENDENVQARKEIVETDTQARGYKEKSVQYQCDKCEKQYPHSKTLRRHRKSAHEGIRYPCNKCNQTFTQNENLKTHIQSFHEGVKFPCYLCDHVATQQSNLTAHKKRMH